MTRQASGAQQHRVKPRRQALEAFVLQPESFRRPNNATTLARRYGRGSRVQLLPGLHFDEGEHLAAPHHEVDFPNAVLTPRAITRYPFRRSQSAAILSAFLPSE